ncbi:hypothetical protein D3C85_772030 [compost metagenome]
MAVLCDGDAERDVLNHCQVFGQRLPERFPHSFVLRPVPYRPDHPARPAVGLKEQCFVKGYVAAGSIVVTDLGVVGLLVRVLQQCIVRL